MTSFTATESSTDTAELFSVPKDQLAHLQIVAAQKEASAKDSEVVRIGRL